MFVGKHTTAEPRPVSSPAETEVKFVINTRKVNTALVIVPGKKTTLHLVVNNTGLLVCSLLKFYV